MKTVHRIVLRLAAAGLIVAGPPTRRVQSHGRTAHRPGRCREHDRRVCVRQGAERTQVAGHGARRLPVRGARASARTSSTSTTTCSTRFTSRPGRTSPLAGRRSRTSSASRPGSRTADDPAVVSGRRQRRERRGPEPDAVLHGHQGRPSQRAGRSSAGRRAAEQPGQRHAVLQPGRRRREARPRTASPPRTSSIATRSSPSRRSTTATSRSPASATTASTPTSRRSSICCSCASPARMRRAGFNLHLMALAIPIDELGGDSRWSASTRRRAASGFTILFDGQAQARTGAAIGSRSGARAIRCSTKGSSPSRTRTSTAARRRPATTSLPQVRREPRARDAHQPARPRTGHSGHRDRPHRHRRHLHPRPHQGRSVDEPARLAGGGPDHPTNPDDPGFSRLSIFGGDVLISKIQPGFGGGVIPGGWPNGRRFGDDVVDIAVTALISDLRTSPPIIRGPAGDNVNANDMAFNKVFPYESTPQNGRRHVHH